MVRINIARWLAGGFAAGILLLVVDIVAFPLYRADYEAAFAAHGLAPRTGGSMVFSFGQILLSGYVLVFLYAAMRPRFGPGARTAGAGGNHRRARFRLDRGTRHPRRGFVS